MIEVLFKCDCRYGGLSSEGVGNVLENEAYAIFLFVLEGRNKVNEIGVCLEFIYDGTFVAILKFRNLEFLNYEFVSAIGGKIHEMVLLGEYFFYKILIIHLHYFNLFL